MRITSRSHRTLAALLLLKAASVAAAQQMNAYPAMSLADGRSTATVTATILDNSGRPVADGTRVNFDTTLGTFRNAVVTTINGKAQAILVASNTAGVATITARPLSGGGGPSTLEYEFVADRSLLSTAREFVEIVAPQTLTYTLDNKVIGAVGQPANENHPEEKVTVRYRDVQIEADQIQLNTSSYEFRAKNATVKIGKQAFAHPFRTLYLRLNLRTGFGTTTYTGHAPQFLAMQGHWFAFAYEKNDGSLSFGPPPPRDRFGLVAIKGENVTATNAFVPGDYFEFNDLTTAPSHITAKRAIVYPRRRIQFQRADIYVAETRLMRVPYYQLNLLQTTSPLITEDWIGVYDNQPEVNYPYYLSLKPGQAQVIRFHTDDLSNRNGQGTSGAYVDYEFDWNKGDDMDGMFALRDLATSQFEVDFQQFLRMDPRTTASVQVGVPINSGYYGSGSLSHQFNGFDTSLNASASQTFRGLNVRSTDYSFNTVTNPVKIKGTPFHYDFGFTTSEAANSLIASKQEAYGPTTSLRSDAIRLGNHASLTTSFTAEALQGQNVAKGLTMLGTVSLTDQLSKQLSATVTYNYTHDGFNDQVIGQHQLSASTFWNLGRLSLNIFGMRSLDVDRETLFGDADFRVSKLWHLRASYTYDRYLSDANLDYTFALTYHIGWREVGLIWSAATRRFGILLLGATIN